MVIIIVTNNILVTWYKVENYEYNMECIRHKIFYTYVRHIRHFIYNRRHF